MYDTLEELVSSAMIGFVSLVLILLFIALVPVATIFRIHYRLQSEKCPRCKGRYRTQLVQCTHTHLLYHCYYCGNGWFLKR